MSVNFGRRGTGARKSLNNGLSCIAQSIGRNKTKQGRDPVEDYEFWLSEAIGNGYIWRRIARQRLKGPLAEPLVLAAAGAWQGVTEVQPKRPSLPRLRLLS